MAVSPCPSPQRHQAQSGLSPCPTPPRQQPAEQAQAGSARDRLRAGLLQRRAQSTDSTAVEPPTPVAHVQKPKQSVGEKRGRTASFMDVLANPKRQCADAAAQRAAAAAADNSSKNETSLQENHFLAFVDGEYKQDEVLSLAVTPDGLWDGESSTPGSAEDGPEPFWGLDLAADVDLVQETLTEVDAADAALVDSWCC